MGYFDSISTKDGKDIYIGKTLIKDEWYQSKDFMYDENNRYWQGDSFIIDENGNISFADKELENIKITGLANIYSDNLEYWLLVDQNKIIKAYQDMYFEELPNEAKKDYGMHFGDDYKLDVNIEKLESTLSKRLLKKCKTKSLQKHNKFSTCKKTQKLKRKKRKKALYLKHLTICMEEYAPFIFPDEAGAFGNSLGTLVNNMVRETRKQNASFITATVSLEDYNNKKELG